MGEYAWNHHLKLMIGLTLWKLVEGTFDGLLQLTIVGYTSEKTCQLTKEPHDASLLTHAIAMINVREMGSRHWKFRRLYLIPHLMGMPSIAPDRDYRECVMAKLRLE